VLADEAVSDGPPELAPFEITPFGRGFLWPDVKVPRAPTVVAERSGLCSCGWRKAMSWVLWWD
jgi:hypothetical protein